MCVCTEPTLMHTIVDIYPHVNPSKSPAQALATDYPDTRCNLRQALHRESEQSFFNMYVKTALTIALFVVAANAATNLRGRANLEVQVAEGNSTSANGTSTESEAPIITQPTGKPWHVIADNYGVMDQVRKKPNYIRVL